VNWNRQWLRELILLVIAAAGLWLVGWWVVSPTATLLAGTLLYVAWMLWQLLQFGRWLHTPKSASPPFAIGLWRTLIIAVDGLHARSRRRKRKLGRILSGFQESTGALPDATVVIDDQGECKWWNDAARRMLGLHRQRHKKIHIRQVIEDPIFNHYLARGDYDNPLQIPAPADDTIRLEVRIVPYGKGKRLLQARDITRLRQLETIRRDFVANVSHEMRTPLTVIHGYLEMMGDSDLADAAVWCSAVEQMRQQSGRMQRIVEDLLMLSRLENSEQPELQEPVDVARLLEAIREQALGLSGGRHQIRIEADAQLRCPGSPGELESAFSNLLFNAVRYTPDGGQITMQWQASPRGPCLSVIDCGIGIEPQHIPRLTERFYRVDVGRSRQSGGTGLGLAIVKHVLGRHGAHLEISSVPGLGSTFSCYFPHCQGGSAPVQ